MRAPHVREVSVPPHALAARALRRPDYADAFAVTLANPELRWVDTVARVLFLAMPEWIRALLRLREALAGVVGLKTAARRPVEREIEDFVFRPGNALALFRVIERSGGEIVLGEDDRHLDFRLSILLEAEGDRHRVTVSTLVRFHGAAGRLYFLPVRPLHRLIVPAMLRRAVREVEALQGWTAPPAPRGLAFR